MDAPDRCTSCGFTLPAGAQRCPDCGFPVASAAAPPRSRRASVAAFLLAVLFALSLFQVFTLLAEADAPVPQPLQLEGTTFDVLGLVTDPAGTLLGNVTVEVVGRPNLNATTGPDGAYRIRGVPAGYVELRFAAENASTLDVRAFVLRETRVDASLEPPGAEPRAVDHESISRLAWVSQVCGGVLLIGSLLTLLGAIACYRRRRWGLALAGAVAGLFALLPLSLLLGGLSIAVVATSRREFSA